MSRPARHTRLILSGVSSAPEPLTGIDLMLGNISSPTLLIYPQGLDTEALAQSLAQVLRHYPFYASRLTRDAQGHVQISGVDAGVPFTVVRHPGPLPAYGPALPMGRDLWRYHRPILPWRVVGHDQAALVIEVHQFACGGAILSLMSLHSVSDGNACWAFMLDWVRTHHGHPVQPPALAREPIIELGRRHASTPYTLGHIRLISRWQRLAIMSRFACQMPGVRKQVWRVGADTLAAWREEAQRDSPALAPAPAQPALAGGQAPSALDMLTARFVQHLSKQMRSDAPRHIGVVTDLRLRRISGIPRKYVGNALGQDLISLSAQTLAEGSTVEIARLCRVPLDRISPEGLLSYLGLLEHHRQTRQMHRTAIEAAIRCLGTGLILNNCAHVPIYKMDFGGGPPSWHDIQTGAYRRLLIVPAPPSAAGGMDVHLSTHRDEMAGMAGVLGEAPGVTPDG